MKGLRGKIISLLLVVTCIGQACSLAPVSAATPRFADVPESAWYAEAVTAVTNAGLMQGTAPGRFSPDVAMTRGMFVTVLGRLAEANVADLQTKFTDVPAASPYAPYIAWATQNGIAQGVGNGRFAPDAALNREQAAVLLARFLKISDAAPAVTYGDAADISSWAKDSIAQITALGYLKGDTTGRFLPQGILNRAQAAVLLHRLSLRKDAAQDTLAMEILSKLSLDEKIGQVLFLNFRNWKTSDMDAPAGLEVLNDEVIGVMNKYHLGNIILFGENVKSTEKTARLVHALQSATREGGDLPLLIGIDQEGGNVTRLGQGTCLPGNMALGATGNPAYAYEAGALISEELSSLGINCDLAPVADVNDNPQNPVIGLRSFGSDPVKVSAMARELLMGLHSGGTIACAKHFPGHGNTATDTHTGLALVEKSKDEWRQTEAAPFATLIQSGVDMVMTAHIQYPKLDGTQVVSKSTGEKIYLPATLSHTILTDLLRGELGFDGVISTDAMDMKAIVNHFGETDAVVMALQAGADLLCNPTTLTCLADVAKLENIYAAIRTAVADGTLPLAQLDAAVKRVLKLKLKSGILKQDTITADQRVTKALATVGNAQHRATERKLAEAAVTLYTGDYKPFALKENDTIVIIAAYQNELASAQFALNRLRAEGVIPNITPVFYCYEKETKVSETLTEQIKTADHVLVLSELYGATLRDPNHWLRTMPQNILAAATANGKGNQTAVISLGLPYDAPHYTGFPVYLTYGYLGMNAEDAKSGVICAKYGPNIAAGIGCALGAFTPTGKCPVTIEK